jgi:hypothetical protein
MESAERSEKLSSAPVGAGEQRPCRAAPHACALVRRTTRTLTPTSASRLAGASGDLRRPPVLSAPQGCAGLLPTVSCESECPPEKLRPRVCGLPAEAARLGSCCMSPR